MIRHVRFFAAICVVARAAALPLGAQAQETPSPRRDYAAVAERMKGAIEREMRAQGLPIVSIALVDDQEVVWSRGFGNVDTATRRLAGPETVFRVGSVSKLFTDLAIMQLVEQGKVDLDAPV